MTELLLGIIIGLVGLLLIQHIYDSIKDYIFKD